MRRPSLGRCGPGVRGARVVVVGAGMAGLGAATELGRRGAARMWLCLRHATGSAAESVPIDRGGVPVEVGAAWLEGVGKNVMVALVQRAGLARVPTNFNEETIRNIRTGLPDRAAGRRAASLVRLTDALEESSPPVTMSVGTWLTNHGWVSDGPDDWAENTEIAQEYALDPNLLGTHAITEGANEYGRDEFVKGGYDRVPRMLAGPLDVRLSTPVSAVSAEGSRVAVTTASGRSVAADLAVVAVPLALMQAGLPTITPMPSRVWSGITRLTTGSLQKVALRFDRDWWRRDYGDDTQIIGLVGGRWTEWFDITNVTGVPSLVGFCAGAAADRRPTSDAACVAEAMSEFRGAYGG